MAKDAVPRWEFFIADRPHAEEIDEHGRRQCFSQISQAEALAMPGDVIISPEVAEVHALPAGTAQCMFVGHMRSKLMTTATSAVIIIQSLTTARHTQGGNACDGVRPTFRALHLIIDFCENFAAPGTLGVWCGVCPNV